MYVVVSLKGLWYGVLPSIMFKQPGGCTALEMKNEVQVKARSIYLEKYYSITKSFRDIKEMMDIEFYSSKEAAEMMVNYHNNKEEG